MQLNSVNLIYQVTRCNISKSFLFITIQEGQSYIYRKHCAHSSLYTLVYVNLTKPINVPVDGEQKLLMQESILSLPIPPPPGHSREFACIFSLSVQFPSAGQEKLCNARPLGKEMITIAWPWDTPTY